MSSQYLLATIAVVAVVADLSFHSRNALWAHPIASFFGLVLSSMVWSIILFCWKVQNVQQEMKPKVLAFVNAQTWEDKAAILKKYPEITTLAGIWAIGRLRVIAKFSKEWEVHKIVTENERILSNSAERRQTSGDGLVLLVRNDGPAPAFAPNTLLSEPDGERKSVVVRSLYYFWVLRVEFLISLFLGLGKSRPSVLMLFSRLKHLNKSLRYWPWDPTQQWIKKYQLLGLDRLNAPLVLLTACFVSHWLLGLYLITTGLTGVVLLVCCVAYSFDRFMQDLVLTANVFLRGVNERRVKKIHSRGMRALIRKIVVGSPFILYLRKLDSEMQFDEANQMMGSDIDKLIGLFAGTDRVFILSRTYGDTHTESRVQPFAKQVWATPECYYHAAALLIEHATAIVITIESDSIFGDQHIKWIADKGRMDDFMLVTSSPKFVPRELPNYCTREEAQTCLEPFLADKLASQKS
jgi:hypothetical protein